MSGLFAHCKSITYLPDINKWSINNVSDISYIFFNCQKLISLPDISKWETTNIKKMN